MAGKTHLQHKARVSSKSKINHILTIKASNMIPSQRSFPYYPVGLVLAEMESYLFPTILKSLISQENKIKTLGIKSKAGLYTLCRVLILHDKVKVWKLWKRCPRPQRPPHTVLGWLFCAKQRDWCEASVQMILTQNDTANAFSSWCLYQTLPELFLFIFFYLRTTDKRSVFHSKVLKFQNIAETSWT